MPEESQLIDVAKTFPTLHIDMKYATADTSTPRACCTRMPPPRWRKRSASPRWPV